MHPAGSLPHCYDAWLTFPLPPATALLRCDPCAARSNFLSAVPGVSRLLVAGFNPIELARNVDVEGWSTTCKTVFMELDQLSKNGDKTAFLLNPVRGWLQHRIAGPLLLKSPCVRGMGCLCS